MAKHISAKKNKLMKKFLIIASTILFVACSQQKPKSDFMGFWQGPHPENISEKFYIQIHKSDNKIIATGYWTLNNFYNSKFNIDSISVYGDSVKFHIPDWNCTYSGKIVENNSIIGGFSCLGEAFDSVSLTKNNKINKYLILPKPGCQDSTYKYTYVEPILLDDKIEISKYQTSNDSLFVHSIVAEIINGDYGRINSFLVLKNNKLICEEYFYGYTKTDLHQIESSTKSITSLLFGIAKDLGMLKDLNEPLYKIFPEHVHLKKGDYKNITIYHLLTMTSGFKLDDNKLFQTGNRIDYALKRELVNPVGEKFGYDGGNTEILGAIIMAKTGMDADKFAKKYLFTPLNIETYNWDIIKQNGFPCMAGSLQLKPRDMAKIGLMVLNNGKFDNKQIVSQNWIRESTTEKTKTHIEGDNYGYQWWDINLSSNGIDYKTIWANGLGSQFIYIIPEINVVIVTTGFNYENDSWAISEGLKKHLHLLGSEK